MITDHNYFFFQAYELLGRYLFGDTWTGNEIQEWEMKSPEAIEDLRTPHEAEVAELDDQDAELEAEIGRTVSEDEIERIQAKINQLQKTRALHLDALAKLPRLDDRYRERFQSVERRELTEKQLIDALADGALDAVFGFGLMVPGELWAGAPGFKYYLELSIAVMPKTHSGTRRGPIFIPKGAFDVWIDGIIPEVMDGSTSAAPEVLCRKFLRDVSSGPRSKSKTGYRKDAMANIEGLSIRQFDRAWDREVPIRWKEPGRPRASNKS
jgi:hypothetical protein